MIRPKPRPHPRIDRVRHEKGAAQVDRDHPVPPLERHRLERRLVDNAGAAHQDVHRADLALRPSACLRDRIRVGDVGLADEDAAALRLDLGDQVVRVGMTTEVEQRDRRALGRERAGDRSTNAATAPVIRAIRPSSLPSGDTPRLSSALLLRPMPRRVALPGFVVPSYDQSIDKRIVMRRKATAKLSSRFQLSIPKAVGTAWHWRAGQQFAFIPKGEGVLLVPSREDLAGLARGASPGDYRDRTDRA
jgi:hypothetical protein